MSAERCKVCRKTLERRAGESDRRWSDRETCSHSCGGRWGRRKREDHVARQPHRCALDECEEWVPRLDGEHDSDYRRRRYCRTEHRWTGRKRTLSARRTPERQVDRACGCGCGSFTPRRESQRFASKSCAMRARGNPGPRETKTCECGCGQLFERRPGIGQAEWGRRRFLDAEHRRRGDRAEGRSPLATRGEDGAVRAGNRSAPRPVPSRDRKTPQEDRRAISPPIRFGQTPTVKRVEPVEKTTRPRPAFGLSTRSA